MTDTVTLAGIVLSSMPVGEADRRLLLLTREYGKISCFARGARKPTSPLVGVSRPFSFGSFTIYPGRNSFSLQSAEISDYFEAITKDVSKTAYGSYFLELCSVFSHENLDGTALLKLLVLSLRALLNPHIPDALVRRIFELRVLTEEGVAPEFHEGENGLSKSAAYALNYVEHAEPGKLFSFTVTEEVLSEMGQRIDPVLTDYVSRPLPAREMLSVLTM